MLLKIFALLDLYPEWISPPANPNPHKEAIVISKAILFFYYNILL